MYQKWTVAEQAMFQEKKKNSSKYFHEISKSDILKKYGPDVILMIHVFAPIMSKYGLLALNLLHIIFLLIIKQKKVYREYATWISFVIFLLGFIISFFDNFSGHVVIGISLFKLFTLLKYSGLQTILNTSMPLLIEVMLMLSFFYLLFAVMGLSLFQNSLSRYCFVKSDLFPDLIRTPQHCGINGKGYQCPSDQVCQTGRRGDGFVFLTYDDIFHSILTTFVASSLEDWTPIMYWTMWSEYYVSSLFYVILVIFISFTLLKLFIAVVTGAYDNLRAKNRNAPIESVISTHRPNQIAKFYFHKNFQAFLGAVISIEMVCRVAYGEVNAKNPDWLYPIELEIVFCVFYLLDLFAQIVGSTTKSFLKLGFVHVNIFLWIGNLVGITSVIWDPTLRPYFLIFNLLRIPRILNLTPRIKGLASVVLKSYGQLFSLFLLSASYLVFGGIILCYIFGDFQFDPTNKNFIFDFSTFWGSMTGVFQLFVGDGWDNVTLNTMYLAMQSSYMTNVVILSLFFVSYYIFAHLIITNLLVAVILENFSLSEAEKRTRQLRAFFKDFKRKEESDFDKTQLNTINRKYLSKNRKKNLKTVEPVVKNTKLTFLTNLMPNNYNIPGVRKETIQKYLNKEMMEISNLDPNRNEEQWQEKELSWFFVDIKNPFASTFDIVKAKARKRLTGNSNVSSNRIEDDVIKEEEESPVKSATLKRPKKKLLERAISSLKSEEEDLDNGKTWFCMKRNNPIRRFCIAVCIPQSHHNYFEYFIRLVILLNIAESAFDTPENRFYTYDSNRPWTVFRIFDLVIVTIFLMEFLIKSIASGLLFTKRAYLRNGWNRFDFTILILQIIGLAVDSQDSTGIARMLRVSKALRVLRIINQFKGIRDIFRFFILAFSRLIDAALLSLIVFIPFALYGNYIYKNLFKSCNDASINNKADCVGVFTITSQLGINILAPRVWKNLYAPYFTFDSFSKSMLTTFVLSTSESWTDIFNMANMATAIDVQLTPTKDIDWFAVLYFYSFMTVGCLIVVNMFAGIIIQNFLNLSGLAYLTVEQRQYIDLMKQIKVVKPTVTPVRPAKEYKAKCFDVLKNPKYSIFINISLCFTVLINILTFNDEPRALDEVRDVLLSFFICVFLADVLIKIFAHGHRKWRKSIGNLFDIIVVSGALISLIIEYIYVGFGYSTAEIVKAKRMFTLLLCFKLIQHIPILVQLMKIIKASFVQITDILGVFVILLLTYSLLFMEIFGLTRWFQIYNHDANFRTLSNAMLLLLRMITGESWHRIMNDCLVDSDYCVEFNSNYLFSDCGSRAWGFVLFMSYYVICTYVFLNMFTVIVLENFTYFYSEDVKNSVVGAKDLRMFRETWAKYDKKGSGFINDKQLIQFLRVLDGRLSVKLYSEKLNIKQISVKIRDIMGNYKADSTLLINKEFACHFTDDAERKREFQIKRLRFNRVYIECMLNAGSRGISMNAVLLVLTKTVVSDKTYLRVDEFIKRKMELEEVDKIMYLEKSTGILATIIQRKRFLKYKQEKSAISPLIPQLLVDDVVQRSESLSSNYLAQSIPNGLDANILSNILKSRNSLMFVDTRDVGNELGELDTELNEEEVIIKDKQLDNFEQEAEIVNDDIEETTVGIEIRINDEQIKESPTLEREIDIK